MTRETSGTGRRRMTSVFDRYLSVRVSFPFSAAVRQAAWQVPALITLAVLVAVGVNQWRSKGIPLVGDWSADGRVTDAAGENLVISLEQAVQLFEQGAAQFVDARPEAQYARGRIAGSLCIPWQELDRYFPEAVERLNGHRTIITYCDGETCDLSHELALFLKEVGFENVRVLVNGWTVWQQAGLPTDEEG